MTYINITNSGSQSYLIDGVSTGYISLVRGNTYYLVINASGHPFWIQSVSGQYDSNNIYNSGVTYNGAETDTIIFIVPTNAPNTLYYVCQYHSIMTGTINITDAASLTSTTLSGFSIPDKTYGDSSFDISAPTTNSNGAFTYTSSNAGVATISGAKITIVGTGTSTITASQAATSTYTSVTITALLTINKATVCLTSQSIINIISSNGYKYVFNNSTTYDSNIQYGLVTGTYVFKNISDSHPMALLNNGVTNSITYTGDSSKKLISSVGGVSYDFYYGDITVQVNGNFGTISVYCYYHGYMGGQDLLKYSTSCIPPLDPSVIVDIDNNVPTVYTSDSVIQVNVPDDLLTSGTEAVKSQKRTTFLEKLFNENAGLASASGKIIMSRDKLLGTSSSVITNNIIVIKKASNTEVPLNISELAANESIYVFMNNNDYTVLNTTAGKLKITKKSEILYTIYENYESINSPVTKTMTVGESSSVGNFVYILGGVGGQLNTPPPPGQTFSMRSLFTNNSQVFYKPNSLSTGSGGSGVRNYRTKQRRT